MSENTPKGEITIFMLPTEVLNALKSEMARVAGTVGEKIFYLAGFEGGRSLIRKLDIHSRFETIASDINEFTISAGIGVVDVIIEGEEIIVTSVDSNETKLAPKGERPVCHLTCGYLSGIVSGMLGITYKGREEECVAKGDAVCKFRLSKVI